MTEGRTMTLHRDLDAPVAQVWRAWTDPAILPQWWGPRGFSCDTARIDLRPGGDWVFDMIGPDGTRYPNQHEFLEHEENARIVYRLNHGEGGAEHATVTVTMEDLGAGTTRLTLSMRFVTSDEYRTATDFGAEALGLTSLDCLVEAAMGPSVLSITRLLPVAPETVWAFWTEPDHLAKWFVPDGMRVSETDFAPRPGATWRTVMEGDDGGRHPVQGRFETLDPPRRLVFTHGWEDAAGSVPVETRVTVTLFPHGTGTRLVFLQEGLSSEASRDGHREGWSQTLDNLAAHAERPA